MTSPAVTNISDREYPEYDAFIGDHPYKWICATSRWFQVLEKTFPHIKSSILAARNVQDGAIEDALPLCNVRSILTGNRLISIPFATISDPLVTDPDGIDFFLPALKETMAATRSAYAEIRTAFNKESIARNTAFKCSSVYKYHFLTLERPIDDIYKALHRTCVRQNISRAVKSGLEIRRAGNIDDVRIFYRLYYGTRKDLLLPSMPLSFFESIWSLLSPIGAVSFLIAELYGKPVASVMLFKFNRRVSGEAMGWDTSYINIRPVAFLYWEAIKMAHSEGYDVFDFGRTDPSNVSLMEFKNRWGTEVSDLTSYIFPAAAVHNRLRKSGAAFSLLRKFIFRSPDSLYRLISALCYRHLG